jgi:hypothetical protein
MRGKAASVLAVKMGSLRQPSLGLPKSKNRRFTSLVATHLSASFGLRFLTEVLLVDHLWFPRPPQRRGSCAALRLRMRSSQ